MKYEHPDMDKFFHRGIAERLGIGIVEKPHSERAKNLRQRLSAVPLFDIVERGGDKETCVDLIMAAMDSTAKHILDRIVVMDEVVHSRAVSAMAGAVLLKSMADFLLEIAEGALGVVSEHVSEHRRNASPEMQKRMDDEMQRELSERLGPEVGDVVKRLLESLDDAEQARH